MKFGVVKAIDSLGRIVLPKELRYFYGIEIKDKLLLIPTEDGILVTKAYKNKKKSE